jgi:MFS transporter, DHA2 family, multidrug resistance protein
VSDREPTAPPATRSQWLGLAVLALPTILSAMDFSALFLALPRLSADLHPTSGQLLWITDIYGFMVAGFLVIMGAVGSRIGQRRLLMIGSAAFGLASAAAAYAPSAGLLIGARALLGIAGATLMPSALGLIGAMFRQPGQRATAISIWAGCLLGGTAVGPVAGGVLLHFFWWGSVFLMGLPVMAILLVAAPVLLPEQRNPAGGRLDLASPVLSLAALLPVVYGLTALARTGFSGPAAVALTAGLGFGVVFVRRQNGMTSPMLDLSLFRHRASSAVLAIGLLAGAICGGAGFLFAQYLQLVAGLSPVHAALWSLPDPAGMIACSLLCPVLARRIRPGQLIGAGLAVSAAGFLALTQARAGSGLLVAVAGVVLVFAGVTPAWVLGTDLIVGSVPPEKAGAASSLSETGSELGMALGVAVIGSIGAAVYRVQAAPAIPRGLPHGAAAAARDSLAGAVAAAARLPRGPGAALLDAARLAFTHGLNIAAAVSFVAAAGLSLAAVVLLRHAGPVQPGQGDVHEPVEGAAGGQPGGGGQGMQAVGSQLAGGHVVPDLPAPGGLAQQGGNELLQVPVRPGHVLALVQQGGQLTAVPALAGQAGVLPQDGRQPARRTGRGADGGEVLQVHGDVALVPGREDGLDVREVLVERGPADAAVLGDLRHRHAGQPVLGDQGRRGVQRGVPHGVPVRRDRLGPDPRHAATIRRDSITDMMT